ncbi:MAG: hypothetical protein PHQ96_05375 [Candidatus Omnitrophica bacterium]|nr:hypothetical protein [Candidatus Omnitrophota bacterium]
MGDEIFINSKGITEIALTKLTTTIEDNNKITTRQNELLLRYTRWLIGLTVVMGLLTALQIVIVFIKK